MMFNTTIILPFIYLIFGFILGKTPFEMRQTASSILTKWVIPLVIIYNISTYRYDIFIIMFGMMIMMFIMLWIGKYFSKDNVKSLCFCYLNIGWLALPIVSAVWGDSAATVVIAAYIGSSIFGNAIGAGLLLNHTSTHIDIKKTLNSPPVKALLIGIVFIPFGKYIQDYGYEIYKILKWLMSFLGMLILGIWLSKSTINRQDIKESLIWSSGRIVTVFVLVTLFILLSTYFHLNLVSENKATLYLFCFLPPAANIIILETHYCKTGKSAGIIACGTLTSIVLMMIYIPIALYFNL